MANNVFVSLESLDINEWSAQFGETLGNFMPNMKYLNISHEDLSHGISLCKELPNLINLTIARCELHGRAMLSNFGFKLTKLVIGSVRDHPLDLTVVGYFCPNLQHLEFVGKLPTSYLYKLDKTHFSKLKFVSGYVSSFFGKEIFPVPLFVLMLSSVHLEKFSLNTPLSPRDLLMQVTERVMKGEISLPRLHSFQLQAREVSAESVKHFLCCVPSLRVLYVNECIREEIRNFLKLNGIRIDLPSEYVMEISWKMMLSNV